jgi:malonyl-CoA/methylmalonyl-CoA synthetase
MGRIDLCEFNITEDEIDFDAVSSWLKESLPSYKLPRKYNILDDLPRNVMGKVTKKELKKLF